jgi:lipoprotein-releasing system permease protein
MRAMSMPFEIFAALRYTRARRSNRVISFITAVAIFGIVIGVTAIITVLSVMNGFEQELRVRILGMISHATIEAVEGGMENWRDVARDAAKNPEVEGLAPYIKGQGMLRVGVENAPTLLQGILPEEEVKVSDIGDKMVQGELAGLKGGTYNIVLGRDLAAQLGVIVGDKVDLMIAAASVTPAGIVPRFRRFTVSGVFEVGMYEYDHGLVLLHLDDAAALYRMGQGVSGVRVKVHDLFQAPRVARELADNLPGLYYISDWTRQHANFFRAVATEKIVMFIILSLIVLVAVINIVSTLTMVVQEKQSDIAILRTLGATPRSIMTIFMVQGMVIGVVGTAVGVICGVELALNVQTLVPLLERLTNQQFLSPDIYYISQLPSKLEMTDVIRVSLLTLILGFVSTLYPSWRAARMQPAEALRYE